MTHQLNRHLHGIGIPRTADAFKNPDGIRGLPLSACEMKHDIRRAGERTTPASGHPDGAPALSVVVNQPAAQVVLRQRESHRLQCVFHRTTSVLIIAIKSAERTEDINDKQAGTDIRSIL
jgi:hypothetical protein